MNNYIAKDYKPTGTETNVGTYSKLRNKVVASVLALGLAGCAAGIDVKSQLRSKTYSNQAYSQSFEVGRKVETAEKLYNVVTPWNMLIDTVSYTKLWKEADKVICEKGGLRKAAEQALNAYTASAPEGIALIDAPRIANEIAKAGCENYSRRDLSNALSKVPSNSLLHPLAKNLDAILENDEGFMKNTYDGGDFVVEAVEVKGDDNKVAPELRIVVRRGADMAILGVIGAAAAGAFSGGAATTGATGGGGLICLLNDSLVLKNSQPTKIQDVKVGDTVMSIEPVSNVIINTKVTKIIKNHIREAYFAINDELFITNDHPVMVVDGSFVRWVRIENLKVGDKIKSLNNFVEIKSIKRINKSAVTVYMETESGNFVVKAGNNFYVVKSRYADFDIEDAMLQKTEALLAVPA